MLPFTPSAFPIFNMYVNMRGDRKALSLAFAFLPHFLAWVTPSQTQTKLSKLSTGKQGKSVDFLPSAPWHNAVLTTVVTHHQTSKRRRLGQDVLEGVA